MSVCNTLLTDDRVVIYTDTVGYVREAPAILQTKVHVANGMAISTRGLGVVGDVLKKAIEINDDVHSAYMHLWDLVGRVPDAVFAHQGVEVTLAGWDEVGPILFRFYRMRAKDPVRALPFGMGWTMAPTLGARAYPLDVTRDQAIALAMVQQKIARKHGLLMCIGGDLEETTVDADGARTITVAEYPDKAKTIRLIGETGPAREGKSA
jgi:hypothetical protein